MTQYIYENKALQVDLSDENENEVKKDKVNGTVIVMPVDDGEAEPLPQKNGDVCKMKAKDPYDISKDLVLDTGTPWSDLSLGGKVKRFTIGFTKVVILLALLYSFICSLDVMGSAFTLIGGTAAGEAISNNEILNNPLAGLMIGVLITVLVQSSSTSTSLIVTMVAAGLLNVEQAIPIVMGANIGTSVTNTIVSLGQVGDREQFRRAFAGATVHDCFNWLAVLILLPLELITKYLYRLSGLIVGNTDADANEDLDVDILKAITKPLTDLIIQLDKKLINDIASGDIDSDEVSLVKRWCDKEDVYMDMNVTRMINGTNVTVLEEVKNYTIYIERCNHLFASSMWSDGIIGLILLLISLAIMMTCLILIVKLLQSMLKGSVAKVTKKMVNANFPGKLSFLTGYLAIIVGAGLTIILQSSSIFTSTLTPLIGIGVVSLERAYPLTLGANIGTTITGLLAALANADAKDFAEALQIALCHLFFNISGIILWYPIPLLRKLPIFLAKKLGNTTSKYRWFGLFYLIIMFFLLPGAIFGLSLAGWQYLVGFGIPVLVVLIFVITINVLQSKASRCLPKKLQTWDFLPLWMHSLKPLDRVISKTCVCCKCCKRHEDDEKDIINMQIKT